MINPYQSPSVPQTSPRSWGKRLKCGFNRAMRAYRDGAIRDGIVGFQAFQAWCVLAIVLVVLKAIAAAILMAAIEPLQHNIWR